MSQSNLVRYGSFDIEALDQQSRLVDAIQGNVIMNIEPGDTVVRFLPAPAGKASPFRVTAMHFVDMVPGLDKTVAFACPRIELKQPCVACQKADEMGRSGNPLDRERAQRISAGLRVYANVINRNNPEGVRVLSFGKQIWEALKAIRKNPRLGGDFTNPGPAGFDIIIHREGSGKNDTKYTVTPDRSNSPLAATDAEIAAVIESSHNLDSLVEPVVPEALLLAWSQVAAGFRGAPAAPQVAQPAASAGPRVGAGVVRKTAVQDAKQVVSTEGVELDDDFNPIQR